MQSLSFKELCYKFLNEEITYEEMLLLKEMAVDKQYESELNEIFFEVYQSDLAEHHGDFDLDEIFEEIKSKTGYKKSGLEKEKAPLFFIKRAFRKYRNIAAIFLFAICAGALFFVWKNYVGNKHSNTIFIADKGERKTFLLADGTSIILKGGSTIQLSQSFNTATRELYLSGEAFFDVSANASMPFIIHTSTMKIKVLGTSFDVRAYPDEEKTEASLINGKIMVSLKKNDEEHQEFVLKPLQKIVITKGEALVKTGVHKAQNDNHYPNLIKIETLKISPIIDQMPETAWTENKLFFSGSPLTQVAKELERWYGVSVKIENGAIEALHFTGNYKDESLLEVLEALHLANPSMNYRMSADKKEVTLY